MTSAPLRRLVNRRALPLGEVPVVPIAQMGDTLARALAERGRLLTLFGLPESDRELRLIAVVAFDEAGRLGAISSIVDRHYPALTNSCPAAALFERELAEQCGAIPDGHPSLRPLRRHAPDHAPAAWEAIATEANGFPYQHVAGDEVHEVAVGPVHAGVIEPGHFRFQCHAEEVLSLEIMLGFQHRGVERLLEEGDERRAIHVAESIAGDTVIAHAGAHCGALEALARSHKSPRAQSIRGIALELERLANHLGDLGAMAGDVAFAPTAAFFGAMRGECLNQLMTISGNRFGRGLVRPGGVAFDITPPMAEELADRLARLQRDVQPVARMLFSASSVQSRFDDIGVVSRTSCLDHDFVGLVARSCEVARDVRHDHPYGIYRFVQIPVATAWAGDVSARAMVRWLEIQRSLAFLLEQLAALPAGAPRVACGALQPNEMVIAMEEGWRGEVVHAMVTDADGRVRRAKVQDPSLRNWPAVALAMAGGQISDFPLCNKSFNLSYAGHDL